MERTKRLVLKIALTAVAAYVICVAMVAITQTHILFPVGMADAHTPRLPPHAQTMTARTAGGLRLVGTRLPPAKAQDETVLVLGFGGNATNADATAIMLHALLPEADIVAFHYRGYGQSEGAPSAEALRADALVVHDHAVAAVKPDKVIAVGMSIGAGVAAYLARKRSIAGLILVTPFDSLAALAKHHYPWAPVDLFLRHRMPTRGDLEGRPTPTALIAGARDRIVPAKRTAALRQAVAKLVLDRTIADAGHNDIYGRREFVAAMRTAYRRITAPGAGGPAR
ncbi:MAG: alpha/beta fold hydrolase [Alphaproteobacteria bacterium]|nr:alpha/beta fold hydrolase [Alphaproteobacteria bacterium]